MLEASKLVAGRLIPQLRETPPEKIRIRRIHRRFMRSKGLRRGEKGSVRLYTEQHIQWARVLDWARTGDCQPIDFAAPPIRQPF